MRTILTILLLVITFICLRLNTETNKLKEENQVLSDKIDSLDTEVFIHMTNETRYEIAERELLLEHKECGEKYEKILSRIE